jgi:CRP-like cAMP-binding protein
VSPAAALQQVLTGNFPDLPPPPLQAVTPLLALQTLRRGRTLFAQGARTPAFYAVVSGEIECRLTAPDGQVSVLEHVQPPHLVGLGAFVAGLPSRYEALAAEASQVLAIGPGAYQALMDGYPGFARALLREFARRFDGTLHLLESARHRSAAERLQLALEQLKRERGQLDGAAWQLRATQAELAALAGVTRQTANAWLRQTGVVVGYRSLAGPQ